MVLRPETDGPVSLDGDGDDEKDAGCHADLCDAFSDGGDEGDLKRADVGGHEDVGDDRDQEDSVGGAKKAKQATEHCLRGAENQLDTFS